MALIVKPDISKIWASTGSTAVPPDAKIATGWTYEMMPFEWENFLQNRNDVMLNHINQRGISEWDALTEYQAARSYVTGSNGVVYFAVITNTGNDPTTDSGTNWVRAFPSITGGGASGTWGISISGSASGLAASAAPITFNISSSEVARFTTAGNLAIGSTTSSYPLYVYRASTDVGAMLASGSAGDATLYLNANGVSQNWIRTVRSGGDLVFGTADTLRGCWKYNGNFVVGGTTSNAKFNVHSASTNDCYAQFTSSLTGTTINDGLIIGTGTASDAVFLNRENASMTFSTNNAEFMRGNASLNLLVGKTTGLGYKVDILGQIGVEDGTIRGGWGAGMFTAGTMGFGTTSNHRLTIGTNGLARLAVSGSGNVSIGRLEPASGGLFEVGGSFVFNPTTTAPTLGANGDTSFQRVTDTQFRILSRGTDGTTRYVNIPLDASGISLASDTSVDALKDIPSNPQTTSYTLALSDRGKSVDTTANVVVPANSAVAFPIGSVVMVTNTSGSNITISINTDTLRLAGTSGIGVRTLAQYGVATLRKISATVWIITGAGVT